MDYLSENLSHHQKAYGSGYGIQYPEGHVIRVYERILKHELGMGDGRGRRMLDFGCGNGMHGAYFLSKGFDVYGVDADAVAIRRCRERMPELASHFEAVSAKPSRDRSFFGGGFDLVLANQVLYYFSEEDLGRCVASLHAQLRKGGILVASMMGRRHYFFRHSKKAARGLRCVELETGRLKDVSFINFTDSKAALLARFQAFRPISVGYYDFKIREDEGSSYHYLFVGQKTEGGV